MPFSLTSEKVHAVAADAVVIGLLAESAPTGPAEDLWRSICRGPFHADADAL